ncbi:hypothetical protein VTK26DRAFT_3696 [Humicola hyalothermophila]
MVRDTDELRSPQQLGRAGAAGGGGDEVGMRAQGVMQLAALLGSSLMVMGAESRYRMGCGRAAGYGVSEPEWCHLEAMLGRLREARRGLETAVVGVWAGLSGDARDGFWVDRQRLVGVNERVRRVIGADLALYARLKERLMHGGDIIRLDDADAERMGLPQRPSARIEQWREGVSE